MSNLETLALAVARCRAQFTDEIGNELDALGTGFWLASQDAPVTFITNRHNTDPSMVKKKPGGKRWYLTKFEIELRQLVGVDLMLRASKFATITNLKTCLFEAKHADCALLCNPEFSTSASEPAYGPHQCLPSNSLATKAMLDADLKMTDAVTFIGYPGSGKDGWWDDLNILPIARSATVASMMGAYHNKAIKTGDVSLVSGMSFSGSSGSPVFSHEKGLRTGAGLRDPSYRPMRIVGIMTGHITDQDQALPPLLRHTGLSYFTRSTSISELLSQAKASGFKHPARILVPLAAGVTAVMIGGGANAGAVLQDGSVAKPREARKAVVNKKRS